MPEHIWPRLNADKRRSATRCYPRSSAFIRGSMVLITLLRRELHLHVPLGRGHRLPESDARHPPTAATPMRLREPRASQSVGRRKRLPTKTQAVVSQRGAVALHGATPLHVATPEQGLSEPSRLSASHFRTT